MGGVTADAAHPTGSRRCLAAAGRARAYGGWLRQPNAHCVLPLATILAVYQSYGSYTDAGIAVGLYGAASAVAGEPLSARRSRSGAGGHNSGMVELSPSPGRSRRSRGRSNRFSPTS